METDSLYYQLLKQLPDTLFKLIDQPVPRKRDYRFDAVEIKKSYRLDGLFVPKRAGLPLYFVEVQYQRTNHFYANLFAKVFSYLDANDPEQEWMAVALFGSRSTEPKAQPRVAESGESESKRYAANFLEGHFVEDVTSRLPELAQFIHGVSTESMLTARLPDPNNPVRSMAGLKGVLVSRRGRYMPSMISLPGAICCLVRTIRDRSSV